MLFTRLSEKFYNDYPSDQYPEMMLKENRPYTQVITEVNGLKFAVPLKKRWRNVLAITKKQKKILKKNIMLSIVVFLHFNILRNTYIQIQTKTPTKVSFYITGLISCSFTTLITSLSKSILVQSEHVFYYSFLFHKIVEYTF